MNEIYFIHIIYFGKQVKLTDSSGGKRVTFSHTNKFREKYFPMSYSLQSLPFHSSVNLSKIQMLTTKPSLTVFSEDS